MDKDRDTIINNEYTMVKLPDGRIVNMNFDRFKENLAEGNNLEAKTNNNQELS